jgi:predicted solute-binding protein
VRKAGADTVVHAEFEAGAEMIRQGLERLNFPLADVEQYLHRLRLRRYRVQEEADLQGTP